MRACQKQARSSILDKRYDRKRAAGEGGFFPVRNDLRLWRGRNGLNISLTRPEGRNDRDCVDPQVVLLGLAVYTGEGDQMVKAGIAKEAGTEFRQVICSDPLLESESIGEELVRKVAVPHHAQVFFAVVNHKARAIRKKLKREGDFVHQSSPIVFDDGLLYTVSKH